MYIMEYNEDSHREDGNTELIDPNHLCSQEDTIDEQYREGGSGKYSNDVQDVYV